MTKTLADLLSALPQTYHLTGDPATPISAPVVESDADLQPGGVFVARAGLSVDGHDFIPRAIERGAAAVVGTKAITDLPVPYVQVENAQEAVGYLAAAYHDFPSRKLTRDRRDRHRRQNDDQHADQSAASATAAG